MIMFIKERHGFQNVNISPGSTLQKKGCIEEKFLYPIPGTAHHNKSDNHTRSPYERVKTPMCSQLTNGIEQVNGKN